MTSSRIEGPASLRPTICASPDQSHAAIADRPSGRLGGRFGPGRPARTLQSEDAIIAIRRAGIGPDPARVMRPALTGAVFFACWALKTDGHDLDHSSRLRGDRVDPAEGLDRLGAPGRRRGLSRHA